MEKVFGIFILASQVHYISLYVKHFIRFDIVILKTIVKYFEISFRHLFTC